MTERTAGDRPASASRPPVVAALPLRPRPRDWSDALIVLLGLFALGFYAWEIVGWGGADHKTLISDVAFLPLNLFAALLAWRAARHPALDQRTRRAWALLAAAFLLYWVGDALWTYYENWSSAPYPSWADAAYLLFYPVLLFGVMRFPTGENRDSADQLRFWLDAGTVLVGGFMVVWYFVLGPTAHAHPTAILETFVNVAYPIGDLVLVFAIATLLLRQPRASSRRALTLLAGGLLLFVIADVGFAHLEFLGSYQGGDWPDWLWFLAQFLMAVSAYVQYRHADGARDADSHSRADTRAFSPIPYAVIFASFGLLAIVGWHLAAYPLGGLLLGALALTTLVVTRQISALRENLTLVSELHHLVSTDSLTGLKSRRHFFDLAEREFQRTLRTGRPLSALMIDIDNFKHINDAYGHAAGDSVLSGMARRCHDAVRMIDIVGRYGGDEFVMLLPETDLPEALEVAQRVRAAVDAAPVLTDHGTLIVTISVGVADAQGCTDLSALLHRADVALYEAKQSGRNTTRSLSA